MRVERRFFPDRTRILFFDLEYYVPAPDRARNTRSGMRFSPHLADHRLLGGAFLTYLPMLDRVSRRTEFWAWSHGDDEAAMLRAMTAHLQAEWKPYADARQEGSPILAGIGIGHSDVPCLATRIAQHGVLDAVQAHDLLYGCRQIDLGVASFGQFALNQPYFAYPKTKRQLYEKYADGKRIDPGRSVWDLYDRGDHAAIEARCREEVEDALLIYRAMCETKHQTDAALKRLKQLRKRFADELTPA